MAMGVFFQPIGSFGRRRNPPLQKYGCLSIKWKYTIFRMNLSIMIVLFFKQVMEWLWFERGYGHYMGNVLHFFWISYLDNIELGVGLGV